MCVNQRRKLNNYLINSALSFQASARRCALRATCVLIDNRLMGLAAPQHAFISALLLFHPESGSRLANEDVRFFFFKIRKLESGWNKCAFECVDDWGPSYYLHCGFVCAHLGERLFFNEANMISSRSVLHVCPCTSVGHVSRTKTHSMPPRPPENSPSLLSSTFRSGSLSLFSCRSGQQLRNSRAQKSEEKEPADQELLGHLIELSLFFVSLMETLNSDEGPAKNK